METFAVCVFSMIIGIVIGLRIGYWVDLPVIKAYKRLSKTRVRLAAAQSVYIETLVKNNKEAQDYLIRLVKAQEMNMLGRQVDDILRGID
jgi:hypothetical protein